jgi:signal transduction histidine kinase
MQKKRSLNDLLLIHELAFIALVVLAAAAGALGINLSDKSLQESQRINLLVQEMQQTRGDLYRQMKELFDSYFLDDPQAEGEYYNYTKAIQQHFAKLKKLTVGNEELAAIQELNNSYDSFVSETKTVFSLRKETTHEAIEKKLNSNLESTIFKRYEIISARTERLLDLKQKELETRLQETKRITIFLVSIPIILATILLLFSRVFLKRSIVKPINTLLHATNEISAGRLEHKAPEEGAAELATLSSAINLMAEQLARSQEALIRTEKQAAQGLLVPMLAHNIRNPLASIRATAQVTDSDELDEDTRESLRGIILTVDKLERWTGSLLAYLHPLRPHANKTSLRQIIEGALLPLQQKVREKSITLDLPDWAQADDYMLTDEHLLEQAIYNLLLNSIEAAPSQSTIELLPDIHMNTIRLMIADRGPGMPFTPDPSAASPGPSTKRFGTGLGIPFAFKVMEALHGSVSFKARDGGGTLIELELPRQYSSND